MVVGGAYSLTAAHRQREIEMVWCQFGGTLMSSTFIYSL